MAPPFKREFERYQSASASPFPPTYRLASEGCPGAYRRLIRRSLSLPTSFTPLDSNIGHSQDNGAHESQLQPPIGAVYLFKRKLLKRKLEKYWKQYRLAEREGRSPLENTFAKQFQGALTSQSLLTAFPYWLALTRCPEW